MSLRSGMMVALCVGLVVAGALLLLQQRSRVSTLVGQRSEICRHTMRALETLAAMERRSTEVVAAVLAHQVLASCTGEVNPSIESCRYEGGDPCVRELVRTWLERFEAHQGEW